jgi:MYXO-CTERM domain-containing protein
VAVQRSVRLADVTGDGRADLCVRPASGLRCHASDDAGFGAVLSAPAERDPTDAGSRIGAATLRIAGGRGVRAGLRPGLVGEGCAVVGPGTAPGGASLGAWLAAIGLGLVASRRRRAR